MITVADTAEASDLSTAMTAQMVTVCAGQFSGGSETPPPSISKPRRC